MQSNPLRPPPMHPFHSSRRAIRALILAWLGLTGSALTSPAAGQAGPGGPANAPVATTPPEVKTGLKLQDIPLHDPWMLADRSTRTYHLYSSASPRITGKGRTGTLYYTSKDLATWEGPRIAFVAPESSWADPKVGAWAPEVHAYKGKYYLFTTLHNPAKKLTTTDTTRPNQMRATRSKSGELKGPWEQLSPLVGNDSGHGMLFRSFDGKLMLVVHQPFGNARGKLYEMEDAGDGLRVVRYREDFSGRRCRRCRGRRRGGRDRSGSLA